jgi:hypothetical protein
VAQATVATLTDLLTQAGNAHHIFEQTVLKGVYDQDWPTWYANYVVQNGLEKLLNQPVSPGQISHFLRESYEGYKQKASAQNWADYTAKEMLEKLQPNKASPKS